MYRVLLPSPRGKDSLTLTLQVTAQQLSRQSVLQRSQSSATLLADVGSKHAAAQEEGKIPAGPSGDRSRIFKFSIQECSKKRLTLLLIHLQVPVPTPRVTSTPSARPALTVKPSASVPRPAPAPKTLRWFAARTGRPTTPSATCRCQPASRTSTSWWPTTELVVSLGFRS